MKKFLTIVCFLALVLVAAGLGLSYWARTSIRTLDQAFRADVAAERSRAAAERRPPLRGEPREANAADEYRAAIAAIDGDMPPRPLMSDIAQAAKGAPAPLPPTVTAYLDRHRAEVAAVREATRAVRCDWRTQYEDGAAFQIPNLLAARTLAHLVIASGHERAIAGDPRSAADRYLEATRFGADLGTNGTMIEHMAGVAISADAYVAAGRLIGAGSLSAADLGVLEMEIRSVEGLLGSGAGAFRSERLVILGEGLRLAGGNETAVALPRLLPNRLFVAATWKGYDRLLREAEAALAVSVRPAREARLQALQDEAAASYNLFLRMATPNLGEAARACDDRLALARVARAAAAIARFKAERGAFPAALADAMPEPPADPFAAGPLRYGRTPDGARAKVWSVGPDLKDDGGAPIDDARKGDRVIELGGARGGG